MGITVVVHKGINVKIVKQYLYGSTKKKEKSPNHKLKSKIMDCYAEGMGINSLQAWIKEEGKANISQEKFVSSDEMWIFIKKKVQKGWIYLCYSKMTKKILAVHIGNRGKYSAKKLINQVPNMKIYCIDNWDAYNFGIKDFKTREIGK